MTDQPTGHHTDQPTGHHTGHHASTPAETDAPDYVGPAEAVAIAAGNAGVSLSGDEASRLAVALTDMGAVFDADAPTEQHGIADAGVLSDDVWVVIREALAECIDETDGLSDGRHERYLAAAAAVDSARRPSGADPQSS
jgi:hypothetical protein